MSYTRVSDEYIAKIIDKTLSSIIYNPCYNLSAIVSDYNGFIPKSSVTQMEKGLSLSSPGIISINIPVNTRGQDSILPPVSYENEVSVYAFNLYKTLISVDSNNVYLDLGRGKSELLTTPKTVPNYVKTALSAIFLESVAMYYSLLSSTKEQGMKNISRPEISRMLNNIRWVSLQLEENDYQLHDGLYNILGILRDLHKTISYVYSLDELFLTTYEQKLRELYGGVNDD